MGITLRGVVRVTTSDESLVLRGERVLLRGPQAGELETLAGLIAADPEASAWWSANAAKNLRWIQDPSSETFVIEVERGAAGVLMVTEENDPDYRYAGLDITLVGDTRGRGIGPEALRLMARSLFQERDHHRLTIDPALENHRAVRAYEKAGFLPVGVMRQYWRDADGAWRDGLLMEMLRDEWRD
jgi:aminoglycoside 6'-N-acetyltransferase